MELELAEKRRLEQNARKRAYYLKNRDRILARQSRYSKENIEKRREAQRAYIAKNRERALASRREWYLKNKERHLAKGRAWRKANPDYQKDYVNANRERMREMQRNCKRRYRATDPLYRVRQSMRSRISGLIKAAGVAKSTSLGLTASQIRAHLEPLFQPGQTWDNYGSAWHVDHIKPCSLFDFSNSEEVKACFSLSNLQPLWAAENIRKRAQYPYVVAA